MTIVLRGPRPHSCRVFEVSKCDVCRVMELLIVLQSFAL